MAVGCATRPRLQSHLVPFENHARQLSRTGEKGVIPRAVAAPSVEPGRLLCAVLVRIPGKGHSEGINGPALQDLLVGAIGDYSGLPPRLHRQEESHE